MGYYYHRLWDARPGVLWFIVAVMGLTYGPAFVLGIISSIHYHSQSSIGLSRTHVDLVILESIIYIPVIDQCVIPTQPVTTKVFWACLVRTPHMYQSQAAWILAYRRSSGRIRRHCYRYRHL